MWNERTNMKEAESTSNTEWREEQMYGCYTLVGIKCLLWVWALTQLGFTYWPFSGWKTKGNFLNSVSFSSFA